MTDQNPALPKVIKELLLGALKGIPGMGGTITAVDTLCRGLAEIEKEERERRLKAYALGMIQDYNEGLEFRPDDLMSVMRKLAADDEAAKTEYYTRLTLGLGRTDLSVLSPDLRYHFIRMVSGLTCYQIEFARELKILKTVPVCGTISLEEAELAHTGQESGMAMQAVNTLRNWGLLKETSRPPREKLPAGQLYDLTQDFEHLMGLLFHPDDFQPESINLQPKTRMDVIIVGGYRFIDNLYATYLPDALSKAGLNADIVKSNDDHLKTAWAPLYLHTGIYDDNGTRFIKLYLTQEGKLPPPSQATNHISCRFEERIYGQEKSKSQHDANYFRQEMDRVVGCVSRFVKPHT